MSVQDGHSGGGYDKSQTLAEQITTTTANLAKATAGTTLHNALTAQLAALNAKVAEHSATLTRLAAEETAERAHGNAWTTFAVRPRS